jgi:2-oxoisovalerate dehydrogenase E2 component (dihydrolipoyl transacylase)
MVRPCKRPGRISNAEHRPRGVVHRSVKVSDTVQAFDQLCEVQSDKASVEITSPFDGIVKELLVAEGAVAKVGEGLCVIEVDDGEAETVGSSLTESVDKPASPPPHPEQEKAKVEETAPGALETSPAPSPPQPSRRHHPLDPNRPQEAPSFTPGRSSSDVLATPATRHYARSKGVELESVAPGSGKSGRVERADIDAFLARKSAPPAPAAAAASSGEDAIIELGRTRYGMWKAMEKVRQFHESIRGKNLTNQAEFIGSSLWLHHKLRYYPFARTFAHAQCAHSKAVSHL